MMIVSIRGHAASFLKDPTNRGKIIGLGKRIGSYTVHHAHLDSLIGWENEAEVTGYQLPSPA